MENVESIILENLVTNEEYIRHVLPHLKPEYFNNRVEQTIFNFISAFFQKHNKQPTQRILHLMSKEYPKFKQEEFEEAQTLIGGFNLEKEDNLGWLNERTEQFCKDRAVYLALQKAINIADDIDVTFSKDAIPSILQEALSVCFDKNVGHDYLDDYEHRWDFYHLKEKKVPFSLEIFNKITNGGMSSKTLNVLVMQTNAGKSLFMCDQAAYAIKSGKKALYITLEMAEERIAERIDCNLLGVTMPELKRMNKPEFTSKLKDLKAAYAGNLVIKEYPTTGAHVGHFQSLLDELRMKKNFIPDVIYIDYINICASQRMKVGGNSNMYERVKSIVEELRGFAVFNDIPILTATQSKASSWSSSDMEMGDASESSGTAMTADLILGGMRTEELDAQGLVLWKHLKSRYNDTNYYKRFVTGIDLAHFRFYDVDESEQAKISERGRGEEDAPVTNRTKFTSQTNGDAVRELDFN